MLLELSDQWTWFRQTARYVWGNRKWCEVLDLDWRIYIKIDLTEEGMEGRTLDSRGSGKGKLACCFEYGNWRSFIKECLTHTLSLVELFVANHPTNGPIFIIKPTRCTSSSNLFFGIKLYRIRTARPDPARKLSANLYDIYHCCVYSEKLLMMDRGTVRNM